jgi:dienelactone hydrolase
MALTNTINLQHEGALLEGRIMTPASAGPQSAVLVMPTAVGLSEYELEQAHHLVAQGRVALVADMYGGGRHHTDPRAAGPDLAALLAAPQTLRSRVVAWYELLKSRPEVDATRVAAIGYCFGGMCVLELARSGADVKSVVSFHGLLTTAMPAEPGAIKSEVAIYTGAKDPFAPHADLVALRQELVTAGARWQITEYGEASHAFTEPHASSYGRPGIAYEPLAARMSWAGTLALLAATIG